MNDLIHNSGIPYPQSSNQTSLVIQNILNSVHKYSHSPSIKDLSQNEVKHKRNTSIHARDTKKLRKIIDEHLEKEACWNTSIDVLEFKDLHLSIDDHDS